MSASLGRSFIPNSVCRPLETSGQKMFCGRFSTSGDVLLTASQDALIKLYDSESVYRWSSRKEGALGSWVRYGTQRRWDKGMVWYTRLFPLETLVDFEVPRVSRVERIEHIRTQACALCVCEPRHM